MKRRDLLKAGLACAMSVAAPLRAVPLDQLLPGSYCRAPRIRPTLIKGRSTDLVYQGTHILTYGAFQAIAEIYRGQNGGRLLATGGGCDDGVSAVQAGRADLGGLCCPIEGSRAKGMPWRQVAWDIKVAVTHPATPIASLTEAALGPLARGDIRYWDEVGGERRPIALVVRRHCPDYFEPVRQLLLDGRPDWSPRALWVETDQQLIETVARFPGAIGFVSRVFAEPLIASGRLKPLAIDGVVPSRAEVEAGRYRLKGPLNLVFRAWDEPGMGPFFDFLDCPQGRAAIGRYLVPMAERSAVSGKA